MTRLENITKYMMALLTALIVSTLYAPIVLTIFFSFYKTRKGQGDSWIYILSNESQPGMYKIGFTSQDDVETRVKQLSRSTSVATPFFLEWAFRCFNASKLEQEIHEKLKGHRISSNKEFFAISLNEAKETIENLGNKYV